MKKVMISGFFNGFHSDHLDYILQARQLGDVYCVVASHKQLEMKRPRIYVPDDYRVSIVHLVMVGLGTGYQNTILNVWDEDSTVSKALRFVKPDIFLRGFDKTLESMPESERKVCEELCIEIRQANDRKEHKIHSSELFNDCTLV